MPENLVDILILGGGCGGLTVAAQLRKKAPELKIAIVEPNSEHYYQPLFTLVGGGVFKLKDTRRRTADFIPRGAIWLKDRVERVFAEQNYVETAIHGRIDYQQLIISVGIQLDWHKISGLKGQLGKGGVCSNYDLESVEKTWECIRNFKGGRALFTYPSTPIKCGGAPQKIMYLAEDWWRKNGIRQQAEICFVSAGASIFAVKKYATALNGIVARRDIQTKFGEDLVAIDTQGKKATFKNMQTGALTEMSYDFIHIAPPMAAPDFLKASSLTAPSGWVDVDKATLQHVRFKNIFSLGDASSLPTSKTGAAIRKQAPVLVANLLSHRMGKNLDKTYDGYTSCPIVTGYGKLILAEFDYEGRPQESFPFDQSKERWSMYQLKKYLLPLLYWYGMLRGRA